MQSTNPNHRAYGRPQGRCKKCVGKQTGAYQKRNRERASEMQRNWRLINQYGITADDFDRMHTEQNGVCAICGRPPQGRWPVLAVDHCHTSGAVRGLLCTPCNQGIGAFRDRPEAIRSAIRYLTGATE
ncbi:MAG: hypothetical protein HOQ47_05220 [Streptomyces sp.]|nr:hypothetical protein [Streptomyces sp.]